MNRSPGARPPEGWSYFVLVPIANIDLQRYHGVRNSEYLIVPTVRALASNHEGIEIVQGDGELPAGFVPIRIDPADLLDMESEDRERILRSAALAASNLQARYRQTREIPQPIRFLLERMRS